MIYDATIMHYRWQTHCCFNLTKLNEHNMIIIEQYNIFIEKEWIKKGNTKVFSQYLFAILNCINFKMFRLIIWIYGPHLIVFLFF